MDADHDRQVKKPKKSRATSEKALHQALPLRQRQRLIDASITALHLYGPTGTTVARVVAIAKLSPGIVRFYFRSKAAMLVASLQFLATEFEERVVTPVVALREHPALALQRLVELYLDPEIASPRKVAVWYAFWGEANARQEYLAICGQKDANFAALVHDLVERMIVASGRRHLDSDAVALGLIGALEMLWQGFAFEDEANIDRALARRRCMAYLRSVFPREFSALEGGRRCGDAWHARRLRRGARPRFPWRLAVRRSRPGRSRRRRFCGARPGRDPCTRRAGRERRTVRAFRNACRGLPHALVTTRRGHFADGRITCAAHGLAYGLDGRSVPPRDGRGTARTRRASVARIDLRALAGGGSPLAGAEPGRPRRCGRLRAGAGFGRVVADRRGGLEDRHAHTARCRVHRARRPAQGGGNSCGPTCSCSRGRVSCRSCRCCRSVRAAAACNSSSTRRRAADAQARARHAAARSLSRTQLERELALAASTQQGETDPDYRADASVTPSPAVSVFLRMLLDAEY